MRRFVVPANASRGDTNCAGVAGCLSRLPRALAVAILALPCAEIHDDSYAAIALTIGNIALPMGLAVSTQSWTLMTRTPR